MACKAAEMAQNAFQFIGTPYSKMDCQAFVEACLKTIGVNKNLAGSNAWYREVMKNGWTGTPEECKQRYGKVPTGAFLFILKNDGKEPEKYKPDKIGNASHIGLVTNEGKGAINSSSSHGCVCESEFHGKTIKNGGWNRVGLWDELDYGFDEDIPDEPAEDEPALLATVYAENGKPVKMRTKPSTNCSMYWEVPCGSLVDIIERQSDWSRIRWAGISGYMMTRFLRIDGAVMYTVHVPHMTKDQAEALLNKYPGAWMTNEEGVI